MANLQINCSNIRLSLATIFQLPITVLCLLLLGCTSALSEKAIDASDSAIASNKATPNLQAQSAFPPKPAAPEDYPQAIADFLNVNPANRDRLAALLQSWGEILESERFPNTQVIRFADVDQDQQDEILIALPAPGSLPAPTQLIIFDLTDTADYQPFVYSFRDFDGTPVPFRIGIWQIEDINQDGVIEIVTQAGDCGAHTCLSRFDIFQWSPEGYDNLLVSQGPNDQEVAGATMAEAEAKLRDRDGDGIQELELQGGLIGSVGAGLQRDRTDIYAWDGEFYRRQERIYDPEASAHPYFKLIDGNAAMESAFYQTAAELYESAIATPFPPAPNALWAGSGAAVKALARFRLIVTQLLLGDIEAAAATYERSQAEDVDYSVWSATFWQAYQETEDLNAACRATAIASADYPELWEPLNAFGYANPVLEPEAVCPQMLL